MSVSIRHIILHQINTTAEGDVTFSARDQVLSPSHDVELLVSELHRIYNSKQGKGYGFFADDVDGEQLFARSLTDYLDQDNDFVAFSQQAIKLLQGELMKYNFAEQGYLMLANYTHVANNFLFVALISPKDSIAVDDTLEVSSNQHLELNNLQLAARIDLTMWQAEPDSQRYISFIRGRAGRKVSDFFLDFMGCREGFNAKEQNKNLMNAVEDYCAAAEFDRSEKEEYREKVFDYCKDQIDSGEEIAIKDLSSRVSNDGEQGLYQFVNQQGYELEEEIPGDRTTLRQLKKFSGTGGGVSVGFEQKHMGERVLVDLDNDKITIVGIPPNLRDQLTRRLTNED
ncbi:nucleoid-associated protein YejK [Psychrobium sp. 1_MG-2023]|uniref:nucleoid-associated protein YejK n=1 Tax=Psychrobium sp. 1_MG-2023 TaxID=3062624 RepID=UPI000C32F9DF|nr:nucleoid-associated protein YejK [Psychrobium sp. 1_MG-2023]MDP2561719.1 nucleoid-associated protein YejK [Psychrobium sp. 1_MG-2023]PKF57119.1 nucleoid-associated protein YejK [Alteromonadales bacterium alter-6D02]